MSNEPDPRRCSLVLYLFCHAHWLEFSSRFELFLTEKDLLLVSNADQPELISKTHEGLGDDSNLEGSRG